METYYNNLGSLILLETNDCYFFQGLSLGVLGKIKNLLELPDLTIYNLIEIVVLFNTKTIELEMNYEGYRENKYSIWENINEGIGIYLGDDVNTQKLKFLKQIDETIERIKEKK